MTKKSTELLKDWQHMDMAQRLSLLESLMEKGELNEEVVAALHELFVQEVALMQEEVVAGTADETTIEMLGHLELLGLTPAPAPKKRRTRKKIVEAQTKADASYDDAALTEEAPVTPKKRCTRKKKEKTTQFAQETMLEFIEDDNGTMILRELNDDEPLVSISFSDKVKSLMGIDTRMVGQAMIHAAIASVLQRQSSFYHAHVYDEEPVRFS